MRQLADEDIGVRVLAEDVDTTSPDGLIKWSVLMALAEAQRLKIGARWRSIQQRRVEQGRPSSGTPRFGYIKDPTTKQFAPDPVTGPLLRSAYLDYTAGKGFGGIVTEWNAAGRRTTRGGEWQVASLIRALDSGFGAGLLITGQAKDRATEFLPGTHEAVITADEWAAYQRARDSRRVLHPKHRTAKWFLSGIALCGLCGARLVVSSYGSPKSTAVCSSYKTGRRCTGTWISRTALEGRAAMWVGGHVEDVARAAWDATARTEETSALKSKVDTATTELVEVDTALGRLATGWATGVLDDAGYRAARADLDQRKRDLQLQLAELRSELDRLVPLDADVYDRLATATENMDTGEWNGLLGKVLRRVEVHPDGLVWVPVVGESRRTQRPGPRPRQDRQVRDGQGMFVATG